MYCSNCGAELQDGTRFCPKCGTAVEKIEDASGTTDTVSNSSTTKSTPDASEELTEPESPVSSRNDDQSAEQFVKDERPAVSLTKDDQTTADQPSGYVQSSSPQKNSSIPLFLWPLVMTILEAVGLIIAWRVAVDPFGSFLSPGILISLGVLAIIWIVIAIVDINYLSSIGIRGAWKWSILILPLYLFIRASKTDHRYITPIIFVSLCVGGFVLLQVLPSFFFTNLMNGISDETEDYSLPEHLEEMVDDSSEIDAEKKDKTVVSATESVGSSVDTEVAVVRGTQIEALGEEVAAALFVGFEEDMPDRTVTVASVTQAQWNDFITQSASYTLGYDDSLIGRMFGWSEHLYEPGSLTGFDLIAEESAVKEYLHNAFGDAVSLADFEYASTTDGRIAFPVGSGETPPALTVLGTESDSSIRKGSTLSYYIDIEFDAGYEENGYYITLTVEPNSRSKYGCIVTDFQIDTSNATGFDPEISDLADDGADYTYGFIFPDSDSRYLNDDDYDYLRMASTGAEGFLDLLGKARNEIYARHGNRFDSPAYQSYFGQYDWYNPTHKVTDSELNSYEKANVQTILNWEEFVRS